MPKNDILTIEEIEAFMDRVRATVLAARESDTLKEALGRLVSGVSAPMPSRTRTAERGRGAAPRRGRAARVSDNDIVDLLQRAPGGLEMRDLQAQLGQHVETIRLKLRGLRQQGLVTTTGPRNQLRYHAAGQAAQSAQHDGQAAGRRARKRGAKAAVTARRGRNGAPSENFSEQVLGIVRGGGEAGVQMSNFLSELKADPKTIRKALDSLRENGAIRVTGNRRSTRYFATA